MDIAISRSASVAELQERIGRHLTGLLVVPDIECLGSLRQQADVLMWVCENPSEFPVGLGVSVSLIDGVDYEHWLIELARVLSVEFACRTICDGSEFGDSGGPYWSIVWDNGTPFLADDAGTTIGDGEGGPVRIVGPLWEFHIDIEQGSLDRTILRESGSSPKKLVLMVA
ncbi:MAG: hypothetical protein QGH94_00495 [Phycisphaerae bacterium]|jgi:hypothetical protein|nr:hypothetical protein [Phycisphaerae bacterium]